VGGIGSGTGAPASALPLPLPLGPGSALAQAQPELSSVQLKPAPQSASALHGASYLGTHALCVVGAQVGVGQSAPGGQDGAASQPPTCEV
jgi:hypothetical protein